MRGMLQKQLSAEKLKTVGLGITLQHLSSLLEGAQADICCSKAANHGLCSQLDSRDAELSSLKSTVAELTAQLQLQQVTLLLIHLLTVTPVLACCLACQPGESSPAVAPVGLCTHAIYQLPAMASAHKADTHVL